MSEHDSPEEETCSLDVGIPERLRVKRRYAVTEAVREQRRQAAASRNHSQAQIGNKNAWKHGKYSKNFIESRIKPCHSTCPDYPCELVEAGRTEPGGDCLDKASVIEYYRAILAGVRDKNYEDFQEIASLNLAQQIHLGQMMMDDIMRDGAMCKRELFDKDGKAYGVEYVPHPLWKALPKMLQTLNLNPTELMLTPKAQSKLEEDDKDRDTIADMMTRMAKAFKPAQGEEE